MSQNCDRCGSPTYVTTMSYFNSEIICDECDELEKLHPDYQKAKAAEAEQVEQGNFNFEGIGLPAGYREWARGKKVDLAQNTGETGGVAEDLISALKALDATERDDSEIEF